MTHNEALARHYRLFDYRRCDDALVDLGAHPAIPALRLWGCIHCQVALLIDELGIIRDFRGLPADWGCYAAGASATKLLEDEVARAPADVGRGSPEPAQGQTEALKPPADTGDWGDDSPLLDPDGGRGRERRYPPGSAMPGDFTGS